MIITSFDIYQYVLPLVRPVSVRGQPRTQRSGCLIHLKSGEGWEGFGEVAPLPGLSKETLDEALEQVRILKKNFLNTPVPQGIEKLNGTLEKWLSTDPLVPSVRFGMESAALNMLAHAKKLSLARLLSAKVLDGVPVHGLLSGSKEQVVQDARLLLDQGFTAFKLKVGSPEIEEDIEKVRCINETIQGRALLHVDANQAWDFDQALYFGKETGCVRVIYIEEPFADITRIPEFYEETTIPVAIDESLATRDVDDIKGIDGLEMIVLKPTVLGGVEKNWQMMGKARSAGLSMTLSSSFESGISLTALAHMAAAGQIKNSAGLDTLKWLQKDILRRPALIKNGRFSTMERGVSAPDVDFSLMQKIS